MMFKILILQAWYNLSDEALEKQINTHLERNSITVSLGSINIIDATVIEAKQSRKRKGKDSNNTQDSEASYNVKTAADGKRKTTYGFKAHANVDEDVFVKKMTFTLGNVHDSQEFDKLLDCGRAKDKLKTCGEVYADSAYANKKNDKKLGKKNNKVLHRAYRNTPLTQVQKQENKQCSSIRYIVERTFGLLKLHHGLGKARYLGLERNKTRAQLIAMSHNLKTGMNIFKEMQRLKSLRGYYIQ
ncbi:Mobile element protein [Bathymodiolus brooksi thiotrophic gill symbiont]|nr:Mobile element protein [Bathymodiolus brooksi thiotrophic gill symbiont]